MWLTILLGLLPQIIHGIETTVTDSKTDKVQAAQAALGALAGGFATAMPGEAPAINAAASVTSGMITSVQSAVQTIKATTQAVKA